MSDGGTALPAEHAQLSALCRVTQQSAEPGALAVLPGFSFPRRPWRGSASPDLDWAEQGPSRQGRQGGGCSSLGTPGEGHNYVTSHLPHSGRGTPERGRMVGPGTGASSTPSWMTCPQCA